MQSPTVLILTHAGDTHAYAVAEAIRRKGGHALLWHTADFPSCGFETVSLSNRETSIALEDSEIRIDDLALTTVWRRRPGCRVKEGVLHPADQRFAESECRLFRQGLFSVLAPDAFWVNPPDAAMAAARKMTQISAAAQVGLNVPPTICSNDPERIHSFIRENEGGTIYKPFAGVPWENQDSYWLPFTSLVAEEILPDDEILRATPGIYQRYVDKSFELRITVMGEKIFSAKIFSQETQHGQLDWRKAYSELKMEPYELPDREAALCLALMRRLGIVFGCIDMIVTPWDEFVFLEVNEAGQFLFIEDFAGLPLLDQFAEFLLQGRSDFKGGARSPVIPYKEVKDEVFSKACLAEQRHQILPDVCFSESEKER